MNNQDKIKELKSISESVYDALKNVERAKVIAEDLGGDDLFNADLDGWSAEALKPFLKIALTKIDIITVFSKEAMTVLEELSQDLDEKHTTMLESELQDERTKTDK